MNKNKKTEKSKYLNLNDNIRPRRDNKYFLKHRWIFSFIAVLVIFILSFYGLKNNQKTDSDKIVAVVVEEVTDGDTVVVVMNGLSQRVRMIGIDAPESVSPNEEENSEYGKEAALYTEQRLSVGMTVYLTFDEERYDQYGRLLAYIWLNENTSDINYLYQFQMVKDGYAQAIKYEPNTKYCNFLFSAMEEAFEKQNGLWGTEGFCADNR